jgi:hypothetical protein
VVGAVVVVVLVVAAVWSAVRGGGEPELSPAQVVSGFFHAQRDGDCARLLDLVSEASWSDGGERSRDEFLDQCEAALEGYRPAVGRLDIGEVDEDGDRVTVGLPPGSTRPVVGDHDEGPRGTLVREDGRWMVRLDDFVLHIGRSVDETVSGYLEAYDQADCERLVGYLSEAVWSVDARTTTDFVTLCQQEVEDRPSWGRPQALAATVTEVSVEDDDRAEAVVTVTLGGGAVRGPAGEAETVRLVKDGLQWRLAGSEALPDDWPGAPLRAVVYAELEPRLVDEVVTDTTCSTYLDDSADPPSAGTGSPFGITRSFRSCYAEVSVYPFTGDDQARRAVESMADAVLNDPLPTASDLDATEAENPIGRDRSLAEWQAYVDTLRPNHAAEVPGLPDALGVQSWCDVEGCSAAAAFVTRGPVAVAVRMEVGNLDDAARILSAQLERL